MEGRFEPSLVATGSLRAMSETGFEPHRLAAVEAKDAAGRLGRIVAAYALACLGAGTLYAFALLAAEAAQRGLARVMADAGWSSLAIVPIGATLVAFLAASPFATAFLVHAESRRVRSAAPYALAGAVIGPVTQATVGFLVGGGVHPAATPVLAAMTAGAVGGWIHWVVAVRSAPPPPVARYTPFGEPPVE